MILSNKAMLIMTSIIRVGQSQFSTSPIDEDSQDRITSCLQSLAELTIVPEPTEEQAIKQIFLEDTQAAYTKMVKHEEKKAREKKLKDSKATAIQPDDLISFRQFNKKTGGDVDDVSSGCEL